MVISETFGQGTVCTPVLLLSTHTCNFWQGSTMPPTILCIDDQEQGLFVRKMVLQREGYSVLTATNGALGLQLMEEHEIDAVVLDYRMTGVDGEAVASAIKRRRPDIPIVMLNHL